MSPSEDELERIRVELQRVLGDHPVAVGSLPVGGPTSITAFLRLLETLPDGAGAEAVIRALSEEGREPRFGEPGAQN